MAVVEIAFFGIGVFSSFLVVHLIQGRLQGDSNDTDFRRSMAVAVVVGIVLRYGLRIAESLFSVNGFLLIFCAIVVAWKVAGLLYELFWWESLIIVCVAAISFLAVYLGSAWAWSRAVGI